MSKLIDLTGQRFGKLTVESRAPSGADNSARWNCKCDCGNVCVVSGRSLRKSKVTDCGCETVRFHDLTGQRFGHLTAEVKMPPTGDGKTRWQCRCDYRKIKIGENDLATTHPKLAEQWNDERNGNLSPVSVSAGSAQKVWWRCEKGHEWKAAIMSRSQGAGCPECAGKAKRKYT